VKKLNLNVIRIDGGTQPRESINLEIVTEYAEAIAAGNDLPPVVVFHDGAEHWLADGFHRWHGHKQAGKASIHADVRAGSLLDAKLYAVGANGAHGLRRTNDDKRKAVQMVLDEPAWKDWSDRAIADACGVSHTFVAQIRRPAAQPKAPEVATVATYPQAREPAKVESDSTRPASKAPAAPPPAAVESFGPSDEELATAEREQEAEAATVRLLLESDDKLAALAADNKKLRAMVQVLEGRVAGLMNEKNAALSAAKSWQRKAEKFEKIAKAAA
jgi:uncharacterized ParB-like nuclease family protein